MNAKDGDAGAIPSGIIDKLADISQVNDLVDEQTKPLREKVAETSIAHRRLVRKIDKALYGLAAIRLLAVVLTLAIPVLIIWIPWSVERSVEAVLIKHGILHVGAR